MHKHFKIKQVDANTFIIIRVNGTQFTTNQFNTKAEARKFLAKVIKHAKELMDTHARLAGKELN